jgi:hypothetical protein
LFIAAWIWRPAGASVRDIAPTLLRVTAGAATVGAVGLTWLAWHGALTELWLATFAYNVHYSSEGYASPAAAIVYLLTMPVRQARHDLLWFTGLAGVVLAVWIERMRPAAMLAAAWIGAAVIAIALNGRDLPQYFVQATPALAFAGAAGLASAWQTRRTVFRILIALLLVVGLWRVGTDAPLFGMARLASIPGLIDNMRLDVAYWRGRIDRRTYLDRFGGQRARDKFAARDVEELADLVRLRTAPDDTILVFGFSPGVYLKADRRSASRFFWSLPVVIEFERGRDGWGSQGLLDDLVASSPAVVVLQKGDWEPDSLTFFTNNPALAAWLVAGYQPTAESRRYVTWRRRETP